jgi:hypothetical protein
VYRKWWSRRCGRTPEEIVMKASRLNPELRSIYRFTPNLPIGRLWRIETIRNCWLTNHVSANIN